MTVAPRESDEARGRVMCALCDWSAEGPMKSIVAEQVKHRQSHGVAHHPEVARRSGDVRRSAAAKQRLIDRRAKVRAEIAREVIEFVASKGGYVRAGDLIGVNGRAIDEALEAGMLVRHTRGRSHPTFIALPDVDIPGLEQPAENATSRIAVPA